MVQILNQASFTAMRSQFLLSYSVIDSFEVVKEKGKYRLATPKDPPKAITDRVVKLRNPWGESNYKGDW
jgi:hypothetical protein